MLQHGGSNTLQAGATDQCTLKGIPAAVQAWSACWGSKHLCVLACAGPVPSDAAEPIKVCWQQQGSLLPAQLAQGTHKAQQLRVCDDLLGQDRGAMGDQHRQEQGLGQGPC